MNRVCRICKIDKSITEYYRNNTQGKNGYCTMCKDCSYNYKKSLGLTSGRGNYANTSRWIRKNRNKLWCYSIVRDWLKDGKIIKSPSCYKCGMKTKELEAHHDDYTKPLRIYWLCYQCHGKETRK